jgi:PIN domain nuclease of toxin-antitoxin system
MPDFLVDTHVVLWYAEQNEQLSRRAADILLDSQNALYISGATWWEIAIKHSLGKLRLPRPLVKLMADFAYREFSLLPINNAHILQVSRLPYPSSGHRDPFDRLLIAQAQVENLTLLSHDGHFKDDAVRQEF